MAIHWEKERRKEIQTPSKGEHMVLSGKIIFVENMVFVENTVFAESMVFSGNCQSWGSEDLTKCLLFLCEL